jgi:hypothetical protein
LDNLEKMLKEEQNLVERQGISTGGSEIGQEMKFRFGWRRSEILN